MSFQDIIDSLDGDKLITEERLIINRGSIQFVFSKSINNNLESIFEKYNFLIPDDYRSFMKEYNCASLYVDTHYGGGYDILSPENIIKHWKRYSVDDPYYPIVWSSHSVGMICINQERIHGDCGYLAWINPMDPDNPLDLNLNFINWLKEIIQSNGVEFWLD